MDDFALPVPEGAQALLLDDLAFECLTICGCLLSSCRYYNILSLPVLGTKIWKSTEKAVKTVF
jgi:hypothetical protein